MSLDLTCGADASRVREAAAPASQGTGDGSARLGDSAASARKTAADDLSSQADREKLQRIAAEFESMLMLQVLRDMRQSGKWDDDEGGDTLGAQSLFETVDVELASQLARVKGLGLKDELLRAFDRMSGGTAAESAASVESTVPAASTEPVVAEPAARRVAPASLTITSDYGWRQDPINGTTKFHKGIDIKAVYGQDVQAAADGKVVFSGTQRGYGTTVVVEHADGTRTRYAHLSQAAVADGDVVAAGQVIGQAGHSGRATGTHLHFEVTDAQGNPIDPLSLRG